MRRIAEGKSTVENEWTEHAKVLRYAFETQAPDAPTLYRGLKLHVDETKNYTQGARIKMDLSSFADNEKSASIFMGQKWTDMAVMLTVESGSRSIPIAGLSEFDDEKEYLGIGEYEVVSKERDKSGVTRILLRQVSIDTSPKTSAIQSTLDPNEKPDALAQTAKSDSSAKTIDSGELAKKQHNDRLTYLRARSDKELDALEAENNKRINFYLKTRRIGLKADFDRRERLQLNIAAVRTERVNKASGKSAPEFTDRNVLDTIAGDVMDTGEVAEAFDVPRAKALAMLNRLERAGHVMRNDAGSGLSKNVSGGRSSNDQLMWSAVDRDEKHIDRMKRFDDSNLGNKTNNALSNRIPLTNDHQKSEIEYIFEIDDADEKQLGARVENDELLVLDRTRALATIDDAIDVAEDNVQYTQFPDTRKMYKERLAALKAIRSKIEKRS